MQYSYETLVPLRVVNAASSCGLVQGLYGPLKDLSGGAKKYHWALIGLVVGVRSHRIGRLVQAQMPFRPILASRYT